MAKSREMFETCQTELTSSGEKCEGLTARVGHLETVETNLTKDCKRLRANRKELKVALKAAAKCDDLVK